MKLEVLFDNEAHEWFVVSGNEILAGPFATEAEAYGQKPKPPSAPRRRASLSMERELLSALKKATRYIAEDVAECTAENEFLTYLQGVIAKAERR